MITAIVVTMDGYVRATFDATGWFRLASDEQVRGVIADGFGQGDACDEIGYWAHDGALRGVPLVFSYLEALRALCECSPKRNAELHAVLGFDVYVDEEEARRWLATNRPEIADAPCSDPNHVQRSARERVAAIGK